MKILTATQIREADQYTIEHEPITSIDLMERASTVFSNWFAKHFTDTQPTLYLFCGMGNNGGDGLAVARLLSRKGYSAKVYITQYSDEGSPDFVTNEARLKELPEVSITYLQENALFPAIEEGSYLIDALWGSGLSRPIEGYWAALLKHLNGTKTTRIALDIPSGLFADEPTTGTTFKAHYTLTFELPKLAFFLPENAEIVGNWEDRSIGLSTEFITQQKTIHYLIDRKDIQNIYQPRARFSHKGSFGHSLIVSGSYGKMGAAVLAAKACLRSGSGLVSVHTPECGYEVLQTTAPEAMVYTDPDTEMITQLGNLDKFTTIGIGPGIGTHDSTAKVIWDLLESYSGPLVLDADALNIIAANKWVHKIPKGSILTPHPKEFERLFYDMDDNFITLAKARKMSEFYGFYIVLKGAYTAITTPEMDTWFNPTGNPGMATGGTGDVLTGVITGLLAQGYTSFEACILGVYLHGLAGDIAARDNSEPALIAGDLIDYISDAYLSIDMDYHL